MKFSNKVYDILKYIAQIFLPALTVFVSIVLKAFNYDHTEIVIIIMTAFDTFLGSILQISSNKYQNDKKME